MTESALAQLPPPLLAALRARLAPDEQILWGAERWDDALIPERPALLSKAVNAVFYVITNKRALMLDDQYNITQLSSAQLLRNAVEARKSIAHLLLNRG